MEKYIWVILFVLLAVIALSAFLYSVNKDYELLQGQKRSKKVLWVNGLLLVIAAVSVVLSIYLYQDIQAQLELFQQL